MYILWIAKGCEKMEIIRFLGLILLTIGVMLIYDARPITRNVFSFGDQNEGVVGLKIVGFVISVIGGFLMII